MQLHYKITIFLLLWKIAIPGFSQGINARIFFDRTEIQIGEQVLFHLQVSKPLEAKVFLPELTDTLSRSIEILRAFPVDSTIAENQVTVTHTYLTTSFDAGIHDVGNLIVVFEYFGKRDTLLTGFASLEVIAPQIDEAKGIYDIKPPISVPLAVWEVLPWVLLFFWLLAGVYVLLWFLKRKRLKKMQDKVIALETAHEIALRELGWLKEEKLWQNGKTKEFYTRLTDILRKYLENRFQLKAMESTSSEILLDLRSIMMLEEMDFELMREILQTADMVKFAKFTPEDVINDQSMDYSVMFILKTKYEAPVPSNNVEVAKE